MLDLKGDLKEIKLRGGRQVFLAKLQQLMATTPPAPKLEAVTKTKVLPADRALGFSQQARDQLGAVMVGCEERYPKEGAHSVLVVVVERDAADWREKLAALHQEYFGPGQSDPLAPVQLEVLDRATHETLERLIAAGLITSATRASRSLFPQGDAAVPPPLSDQEKAKAEEHRAHAARKLKMARLLGEGEMTDETREVLLETIRLLGRAFAVENRLPEPTELNDVLLPPLSHVWKDSVVLLRNFVADAAQTWQPVLQSLSGRVRSAQSA